MSFTYERVTPEMVTKYDMQQDYQILINHHPKEFFTYGVDEFWGARNLVYSNLKLKESQFIAINKEKECYLRYGSMGMSEIFGVTGHWYYLLFWQGQRIYFIVKTIRKHATESEKEPYSEHHIVQMKSLNKIALTTELYSAIEAALTIDYSEGHTYRRHTNNHFNFYSLNNNFDN